MQLSEYLASLGRGGTAKFARKCKIPASNLGEYSRKNRPVPPYLCVRIEEESLGAVTRPELESRWSEIWPEIRKKYNADGSLKK